MRVCKEACCVEAFLGRNAAFLHCCSSGSIMHKAMSKQVMKPHSSGQTSTARVTRSALQTSEHERILAVRQPYCWSSSRTIMNVSEEPRNWMFTKGAMTNSSVPPAPSNAAQPSTSPAAISLIELHIAHEPL